MLSASSVPAACLAALLLARELILILLVTGLALLGVGYAQKWLVRFFCPELNLAPDDAVRKTVLSRAIATPNYRQIAVGYGVMALLLLGLDRLLPNLPGEWLGFAVVISVLQFGNPCAILLSRTAVRRSVRECLNSHGVEVCLSCGYGMRGRAADRCPECGATFSPFHQASEIARPNRQLPWVTGLCALAFLYLAVHSFADSQAPLIRYSSGAAFLGIAAVCAVGLIRSLRRKTT